MKNSCIHFFIIILSLTLFSCHHVVNMEQEKEAILSVLDAEGQAYAEMDKDKLYGLFIQDELNTRLAFWNQGYEVIEGWESIKSLYDGYWENWTREGNPRNLKKNAIIRVSGNTAWVLCDNIWEWDTPTGTMSNTNIQTTFMEKINGSWKISFMSFIPRPADEQTLSEIERLRNELMRSLNENDIEGILATHMKETVYVAPDGHVYLGLDEIRQLQEDRIAQTADYDGKGEMNVIETHVFPGIAYDRFQLKIELKSKEGKTQQTIYNQGYWIYHQQNDGSWKLAHAIVTDYKP